MRTWMTWGLLASVGILAVAVVDGCSGRDTTVGSMADPVDGASCATPGATSPAKDGCNTCTCGSDGKWECTLIGCGGGLDGGAQCIEGETRVAADGCNKCVCTSAGGWACTEIGCPTECMPGETKQVDCNSCGCTNGRWACTLIGCPTCPAPKPTSGACDAVIVWAKDPASGTCCQYGTPCTSPADWKTFYSEDECQKAPFCPAPADPGGVSCPAVVVYAKDPTSGACCEYGDPCRAPKGWVTYPTAAECQKACSADNDCPALELCVACTPNVCADMKCVSGTCKWVCP